KSLFLWCLFSSFSDPDQLQDFCVADLKSTTTVVNGFPCKPVSQVTSNDVTTFPGLNTSWNSNISREVLFGFISTINVLYSKVLISAYNSQLPGIALLPLNLFASNPTIPNEILAKNLQVDVNVIAIIKSNIKTTSSFFLVLCLSTILFFTLSCFSSDPDPLQDFCVADLKSTTTVVNGFPCKPVSQVTSNDFFYSGLMNGSSTANPLGIGISPADVNNFPGVNTLGLAAARVDFAAGGYIPLHSHPRASEIIYIISGEIHIGFVSTTNVFYSKVLKSGELSIIPRGLVHSVSNAGQGKAVMIATFNSQQPGFAQIPSNLFASNPTIPNEILAKNFQVDVNVIAIIKSNFSDPDQLQDFCVADLKSTTTIVNGFPCKRVSQVTSNDVTTFPGLNTSWNFNISTMAAAKFSIKTTSSFFLVLCLSTIIFFTLSCFSSDPDPLQDFCVADLKSTTTVVNGFPCKPVSQVTSNDFFYSGLMNGSSTANPLGIGISPADVNNFPGVNTLGLAAARVDFAAGGYIPLHSHPRASEIIYIISGEIHIGFVSTTNVFYSKVLKSGELSIIPRGLVHSVSNAGQGKAVMIATFNSQQPGFAQIPSNLFASNPTIPNEILAKNFQVDVNVIAIIKSKFGNLIN
ncbi:hypothetical protein C5167_041787, partial [Papaver somniferum]